MTWILTPQIGMRIQIRNIDTNAIDLMALSGGEEGEIDLALKSVRQLEQVSHYGGDRLLRVAQAAAETRPQAAVELYRKQAEKLIQARGRERYQQACIYLAKVRDLYRQMSQESTWTDFMAEFRERHRRLRALQDELSKAGL